MKTPASALASASSVVAATSPAPALTRLGERLGLVGGAA
jgi:hypothetical protein